MTATITTLRPVVPETLGSITVRVDRIYGNLTVYPACPRSETIARIAGTKTLTLDALAEARRLGFEVRFANGSSEEMADRLVRMLSIVRVRP